VIELLCAAEATPDNPQWHKLRRNGIGASEIAAVMGISPWDSPFSLYWRKVLGSEVEPTDDMSTGTRLEPVIADWWADTHGTPSGLVVARAGLYAHPERPWQLATPDRLVHPTCACCSDGRCGCSDCRNTGVGGPPHAVLECKWVSTWDGWGQPGSDEIPVHYRAQTLWQCDVLGVGEWHLAALGPSGFRAYRGVIGPRERRDLTLMREHAARFLRQLEAGSPPSIDSHAATLAMLKELHPDLIDEAVEVSSETATLYRRARALRARADALVRRAEARLRSEMGNRRVATHNGRKIAIRSVYETQRIDTGRLRDERPDIADQYLTVTTTDRITPVRSKS